MIHILIEKAKNIKLCEFNDDEPIFLNDFVAKTEYLCTKGIETIRAKSKNIEEAVVELIELLYPGKQFDL